MPQQPSLRHPILYVLIRHVRVIKAIISYRPTRTIFHAGRHIPPFGSFRKAFSLLSTWYFAPNTRVYHHVLLCYSACSTLLFGMYYSGIRSEYQSSLCRILPERVAVRDIEWGKAGKRVWQSEGSMATECRKEGESGQQQLQQNLSKFHHEMTLMEMSL